MTDQEKTTKVVKNLIKKGLLLPEDEEEACQGLSQTKNTFDFVNFLFEIVNVKSLINDEYSRQLVGPELQIKHLGEILSRQFDIDIKDKDGQLEITNKIRQCLQNSKDLISFYLSSIHEVYELCEGKKISEEDFQFLKNIIISEENDLIFGELFPSINPNKGNSEELMKNLKNEIQFLEQDQKTIPSTLIENSLRKYERKLLQIELQNLENETDPKESEQQIQKIIETCLNQLKPYENMNKPLTEVINLLKKREDPKRTISVIRKQIELFDINDFERLYYAGNKQNNLIENKGAIVIVGLSKTGKTTTITSLLGYKMQKTTFKGLSTIQPIEKLAAEHKKLINSPEMRSITRHPAYFKIPQKYIEQTDEDNDMDWYIVDSPGFQDTSGQEVELSNRTNTIEALKRAKKLQILVLISEKSLGGTAKDINVLAETVASIPREFKKSKDGISFIYNNFPNEESLKEFSLKIRSLRDNLLQNSKELMNEGTKQFYTHLINKSKKLDNMIVVDPLSMNPQNFFSKTFDQKFIQNPRTQMLVSFTNDSKRIVRQYCNRCVKQFNHYFDLGQVKEAEYYLNCLNKFDSLMGNYEEELGFRGSEFVMKLKEKIQISLQKRIKTFGKQFLGISDTIYTDEKKNKEVFEEYLEKYNCLKGQIEKFSKIHEEKSNQLINQMKQIMTDVEKKLSFKLLNVEETSPSQTLNNLKYIVNSNFIFCQKFKKDQLKNNLKSSLTQKKNNFCKTIIEVLEEKKEDSKLEKKIQLFKIISQCLQDLQEKNCEETFGSKVEEIYNGLKRNCKCIDTKKLEFTTEFIGDKNEDSQNVEKLLNWIKICKSYPKIINQSIIEEIKRVQNFIMKDLPKQKMNTLYLFIQEKNQDGSSNSQMENDEIDKIKKIVKDLKFLDSVPSIQLEHQKKIQRQINLIQSVITNNLRQLKRVKEAFENDDIITIRRALQSLNKTIRKIESLVNIIDDSEVKEEFDKSTQDLFASISQFCTSINFINELNFRDTKKTDEIFKEISKINLIKENQILQKRKLKEHLQKTVTEYEKKIIRPIDVFLADIQQDKIWPNNRVLESYYVFYQIISYKLNVCSEECRQKLILKNNQIREKLTQKMKNSILEPTQKLINSQEFSNFEDVQVGKLLQKDGILSINQIDRIQKIYLLCDKILHQNNVREHFSDDAESAILNIQLVMQKIQVRIRQKVQNRNLTYNNLQKLRDISERLKRLDNLPKNDTNNVQKKFEILNKQIYKKLISQTQNDDDRLKDIFQSNFCDFQTFMELYEKFVKNNSLDMIQKMKVRLRRYQMLTLQKLKDGRIRILISENNFDQDLKNFKNYIYDLKDFMQKRFSIIQQQNKEKQLISANIFEGENQIERDISQKMHALREIISKQGKNNQKQFSSNLRLFQLISNEIKGIKGLNKKNQKLNDKFFNDLKEIWEQNSQKIKVLSQSPKQFGQNIDHNFNNLFHSVEVQTQQKIKYCLKEWLSEETKKTQTLFVEDFSQFVKKKQSIQQKIKMLPLKIKEAEEEKFIKVIQNIEERFQQKMKEDLNNRSLSKMFTLCQTIQKSNNKNKEEEIKMKVALDINDRFVNLSLDEIKSFINTQLIKTNDKVKGSKLFKEIRQMYGKQILKGMSTFLTKKWNAVTNLSIDDDDGSNSDSMSETKKHQSKLKQILRYVETMMVIQDCGFEGENLNLINEVKKMNEENMGKLYQPISNFVEQFSKKTANDSFFQNKNFTQEVRKAGQYQGILKCLKEQSKTRKNCEKQFHIKPEQIKMKYTQLNNSIDKIVKYVSGSIQKLENFMSENFKDESDKEQIQRIEEIFSVFEKLQNMQNSYNQYLYSRNNSTTQQIIIVELKKNLINQAKVLFDQVKKNVENLNKPEQIDTKVDEIINYSLKLIKNLGKNNNQNLKQIKKCLSEITKLIEIKEKNIKQSVNSEKKKIIKDYELLKQQQNSKVKQFQLQRQRKIQKIKTDIKNKIQTLTKKMDDLINNDGISSDQKKKYKQQKQTGIQNLEQERQRQVNKVQKQTKENKMNVRDKFKKEYTDKVENYSKGLLLMKKLENIGQFKDNAHKFIEKEVQSLKKNKETKKIFTYCTNYLKQSDSPLAQRIMSEHSSWKSQNAQKFKNETSQTDSYVTILEKMKNKKNINVRQSQTISSFCKKFYQKYREFIPQDGLARDKRQQLTGQITNSGLSIRKSYEQDAEGLNQDKCVHLLAKIFALWSIVTGQVEQEQQSVNINEINILYKPHAAQIVSILLLLCFDKPPSRSILAENRLAEIKTGEGKSINLAALSMYLAIFGYEVHCACYSQILSLRDEREFEDLFIKTNTKKSIKYGIFQNIIKQIINFKQEKTFAETLKEILQSQKQGLWEKFTNFFGKFKDIFTTDSTKNKKILIIDEIDVLFDTKYFGDTYNLSVSLCHHTIRVLLQFIWRNRNSGNLSYKMVKQSGEFKNVVGNYPSLEKILKNQIHGMLASLETFDSLEYIVKEMKIMYKGDSTYSADYNYRFNTAFAYLKENESGKVSEEALNKNLCISLCISEFSFAHLPNYYAHILGVSGTLQCLPAFVYDELGKFKIRKDGLFIIPSVYGEKSQRIIEKPIYIKKENHYSSIVSSFQPELQKERPILIFFRNKNELISFYQSSQFNKFKRFATYLTEEHDDEERTRKIKEASTKQMITLMTSSYIRGIDFKSNKAIEALKGHHAIVTFQIETEADDIQANGRVARQGKSGSIARVIARSELDILGINENEDQNHILQLIPQMRKDIAIKVKTSIQQNLKSCEKRHNQTVGIFVKNKFSKDDFLQYIFRKNQFLEFTQNNAKILILIDATCSMSSLMEKLKIVLPQVFEDTYATLKKKGSVKGGFEIQLILYRNYNSSAEEILNHSAFESQSFQLKQFVEKTNVSGGWGNQAVEVALQYANSLQDIREIIIFGDAAGNSQQQVGMKRNSKGENYWIQKNFPKTNTENELLALKMKNIPIHSFSLTPHCKSYFDRLAQNSRPPAFNTPINIYQNGASNLISQFIVERALTSIGGSQHAGQLIKIYKQLLKKKLGT